MVRVRFRVYFTFRVTVIRVRARVRVIRVRVRVRVIRVRARVTCDANVSVNDWPTAARTSSEGLGTAARTFVAAEAAVCARALG